MMKTKLIKSAGLFLMATLMLTTVNAQSYRQGGRGSGPNGPGNGRMSAHLSLDLTSEQEEAMKTLRTEQYNAMKPLRNQMLELKARENTLMSEESVDLKAVNKNIDEQTDLMNQMRKIQASHKVEVKKILTDEQQMLLEQRIMQGRNSWKNGNGKGCGYGQCPAYGNGQRSDNWGGQRPYNRNIG